MADQRVDTDENWLHCWSCRSWRSNTSGPCSCGVGKWVCPYPDEPLPYGPCNGFETYALGTMTAHLSRHGRLLQTMEGESVREGEMKGSPCFLCGDESDVWWQDGPVCWYCVDWWHLPVEWDPRPERFLAE